MQLSEMAWNIAVCAPATPAGHIQQCLVEALRREESTYRHHLGMGIYMQFEAFMKKGEYDGYLSVNLIRDSFLVITGHDHNLQFRVDDQLISWNHLDLQAEYANEQLNKTIIRMLSRFRDIYTASVDYHAACR